MRDVSPGRNAEPQKSAQRAVLAIAALEQPKLLRKALQSFIHTRGEDFRWTVVIGDVGNGTWDPGICSVLSEAGTPYVALRHGGWLQAAITNSLLDVGFAMGADVLFCATDSVVFEAPGWDRAYWEAISVSGLDHLVHFDPTWKGPVHDVRRAGLRSMTTARSAQGTFFTVTKRVFDEVGYLDETCFHSESASILDFTQRCCLAGFNESEQLWDVADGAHMIGHQRTQASSIWMREDDWRYELGGVATEREHLESAFRASARVHLGYAEARIHTRPPEVLESGGLASSALEVLESRGLLSIPVHELLVGFDLRVVNLRADIAKWTNSSSQLSGVNLIPERAAGFEGSDRAFDGDWHHYVGAGLATELDWELGFKAIESRGAWAYLGVLREAMQMALRRKANAVLVFDDDIVLSRDFKSRLETLLCELPKYWHLLYLGWTPRGPLPSRTFSESLQYSDGKCNGSFAVAISKHLFDDVLSGILRDAEPFDEILRRLDREIPDLGFAARTPIVMPVVTTSAIREGQSQVHFAAEGRWNWRDFTEGLSSALVRPTSNIECPVYLGIEVQEYGPWTFRLASILSGDPDADVRVLWMSPHSPGAVRMSRALVNMDPRFSALLTEGGYSLDARSGPTDDAPRGIRLVDQWTALNRARGSALQARSYSIRESCGGSWKSMSLPQSLYDALTQQGIADPVVDRIGLGRASLSTAVPKGAILRANSRGVEAILDA